ncbi:hypothetical protein BDY24DRAFT_277965 [Mrakia frigida]|uniref:uncharacterized protein n=1 Tax=Mrakia frigida TaxID=29902 RepID=UPI003FCC2215
MRSQIGLPSVPFLSSIEPKRLFTNISAKPSLSNPNTVKRSLPTSKSLTFAPSSLGFQDVTNASATSSSLNQQPAAQKTPHLKKTAAPSAGRLKTPGPTAAAPPPMATPLPSATRARRRSKQMHTPLPSAGAAMSTPEGKGGMAADLSFEMEEGGVESMVALGELQEGVEFDDEAEVEYMAPTAYIEPFSLPYEVTSAKVLGDHIRSMPGLVFWPTDEEDTALPEVELDEAACFGKEGEQPTWTVGLKSIDSDDELDLGLPKPTKLTPKTSPRVSPTPNAPPTAARRAPTLTNAIRAAPPSSTHSSTSTRKPILPTTSRLQPKPSSSTTTVRAAPPPSSSRTPLPTTIAAAPRKGLSTTKPFSLTSRLPSNTNIRASAPLPSSLAAKPTLVSSTITKPSSLPPNTAIRRPITSSTTRPTASTTSRPVPRLAVTAPRSTASSASLRAPVPRDMAAERRRREEEGKEVTRGLDEFELGMEVGVVEDVAFEISDEEVEEKEE